MPERNASFRTDTAGDRENGRRANVHLARLSNGDNIAFMHTVCRIVRQASVAWFRRRRWRRAKEDQARVRNCVNWKVYGINAAATEIDGTQMSLLAVPVTSPAVEALE